MAISFLGGVIPPDVVRQPGLSGASGILANSIASSGTSLLASIGSTSGVLSSNLVGVSGVIIGQINASAAGVSSINGNSGAMFINTSGTAQVNVSGQTIWIGTQAGGLATRFVGFSTDGGGSTVMTGVKAYDTIPFAGTITGWTISAFPSGSVTIDVYKVNSGSSLPDFNSSIVGNNPPTLTNGFYQDNGTLTNWSPIVSGYDRVAYVVKSVTNCTQVSFKMAIVA